MKKLLLTNICLALSLSAAYGAEQTWTGRITDSMCGANHNAMTGGKMSDRDCTLACVKSGQKFALASNGHVYTIANQNFTGLRQDAGEQVTVMGEPGSDSQSITIIQPKTQQ